MPKLVNLSRENSVVNRFVADLRNVNIQNDRMRFRKNLHRIAEVIAYEISKTFDYDAVEVETPLGIANTELLKDQPVIACILRAGLPMHEGMLHFFDHADNAFISAYRRHHKDGSFEINTEYISCPPIDDRVLVICDPMIASGASMSLAIEELIKRHGRPREIHIACAIAASEGLELIQRKHPQVHIWAAAIDEELTAKSYIVPGLGDAGDLAFGEKSIS